MKSRKWMAVLVVLIMVFSLGLAACQGQAPAASTPPDTGASSSDNATTDTTATNPDADVVLTADQLVNHELYKHLDDQALTGVTLPILNDRSSINKALPVTQKSNVVVGWTEPAMASAWFAGIQEGAQTYAQQYGYDLKFYAADNWDVTQQTTDIENMITMGIDVLVLDAADIQAQTVDIQKCIDHGIPVISVYPMPEDVPVITAVTANYYEVSFKAGEYAAQQFDGPIEAVFIPGQVGHPIADSRTCGFMGGWCYGKQEMNGTAKPYPQDAMLDGYNYFRQLVQNGQVNMPDYDLNVVGMADGGFADQGGQDAAETLLTAHPNVSLIFPDNDHEGAGAIKVLEQRNLLDQVKVITGCDGDTSMMELVRDGKLTATGYNNPIASANAIMTLIHMIFEEGYDANNMPAITPLPYQLITADNYTDFYVPGTEWGKVLDVNFQTIDELNAAARSN